MCEYACAVYAHMCVCAYGGQKLIAIFLYHFRAYTGICREQKGSSFLWPGVVFLCVLRTSPFLSSMEVVGKGQDFVGIMKSWYLSHGITANLNLSLDLFLELIDGDF